MYRTKQTDNKIDNHSHIDVEKKELRRQKLKRGRIHSKIYAFLSFLQMTYIL